ncbi:MAG: hypothetical protein WCS69_02285 [Ignavibacteriaceae bacterium]|jgi:hypothetical protein
MINEPTLFILGAGASAPYGFPTAKELKEDIIKNTSKRYFALKNLPANNYIQMYENRDTDYFNNFADYFTGFTSDSIDLFLATHEELVNLGKEAIVLALSEKEMDLVRNPRKTDWVEYLYSNFIISGISGNRKEDFEKFKQNKVSFITFNYERSLEFLFWNMLSHFHGKMSREEIYDLFKTIKIHHIYGDLGQLVTENGIWEGGMPLGGALHLEDLPKATKNIKTIYERRNHPKKDEVSKLFDEAKMIVFLGFGFAQENLDILFDCGFKPQGKHFLSTSFGIRYEIPRRIKSTPEIFRKHFLMNWKGEEELRCKDLLEKYYLSS